MKKQELANYTVEVPITFTFKARRDLDGKVKSKMIESYLDLVLSTGRFDVKEKQMDVVKVEPILTEEEKEQKAREDKIFRKLFGRV